MSADSVIDAIVRWRRVLLLDIGPSRAAAARLRRCSTILDALLEPETVSLIKGARAAAKNDSLNRAQEQRLVLLAMALAHRPNHAGMPFAAALGRTEDGRPPGKEERPCFSPARFGALLRAAREGDWDRLARAFRRAFAILGEARFDVPKFIADILYLDDRVLQRWTYDYWQTRPPEEFAQQAEAPPSNETESLS